ncbi:hypothetical protein A3Q56_07117 [Intoshia linei]|uniref:PA domain-containing protein n=1 Tax=Intoshia linei TaxID=1819745 RepID=A0A177AVC4_9BILA|nr:hypothetical protein A3Q56_07117 [Intoshia linei]
MILYTLLLLGIIEIAHFVMVLIWSPVFKQIKISETELIFQIIEPRKYHSSIPILPGLDFGKIEPENTNQLLLAYPITLCSDITDVTDEYKNSYILAKRGYCTFLEKAINAEKLKANGVIIFDSERRTELIHMGADHNDTKVNIGVFFMDGNSGYILHELMANKSIHIVIRIPVNISNTDIPVTFSPHVLG